MLSRTLLHQLKDYVIILIVRAYNLFTSYVIFSFVYYVL